MTAAMSVSGTAKRIVRASASTSAVVRETRSPVPARSTVERGSASTRRMKSSRSSAKIRSESTNDVRRANQVRIVCAIRKAASTADERVHVACRRPVVNGLDERAEQRRPGEAAGGRDARAGRSRRRGRGDACAEAPRLRAQLLPFRDGKQLVHPSAPRVTISR